MQNQQGESFEIIDAERLDYSAQLSYITRLGKEYIKMVEDLPAPLRKDELFANWSLKDILAHFSGWNILTIESIECILNGGTALWFDDSKLNDFNHASVSQRSTKTWCEVFEEFTLTLRLLIELYSRLTPDQLKLPFGDGTVSDALPTDINHYMFHYGELKEVLESLEN